jgi:hypothetical protein
MVHYFLRNEEKKKRHHKADYFSQVAHELCDTKKHDFKVCMVGKALLEKKKRWMMPWPLSHQLLQEQ